MARLLGLPFLPWQQEAADLFGELDEHGLPAHRLGVLIVPRRAGKTVLVLATSLRLTLAGPDRRVGYLAQSRADAADTWRDEWWPALRSSPLGEAFRIRESNGSETIRTDPARIPYARPSFVRLLAPTRKAGHSKAFDQVWFDEAWAHDLLTGQALEAGFRPTQATRPGPQTLLVSAAGTAASTWLMRYRDAGRRGDPGICYLEYGAEETADRDDPATWRSAHPALGLTVPESFLAGERATMPDRAEFDRAYLGIWPSATFERAIDPALWLAGRDPEVKVSNDPVFTFDVRPDRSAAAIAAASMTADGLVPVELVDHREGIGWLVPRLLELYGKWGRPMLACDGGGPAGSIAVELLTRRLRLEVLAVSGYTDACETFYDLLTTGRIRHSGQAPLDAAVDAAVRRHLGESWAWTRRATTADISPLVAVTVAAYQASRPRPRAAVGFLRPKPAPEVES